MVNREEVEAICLETMRNTLNDYESIKAELDLYKKGIVIPLPVDKNHANGMLIIAMNYLGIKPGEPAHISK